VTSLAGPLNYVAVNPKIACHLPQAPRVPVHLLAQVLPAGGGLVQAGELVGRVHVAGARLQRHGQGVMVGRDAAQVAVHERHHRAAVSLPVQVQEIGHDQPEHLQVPVQREWNRVVPSTTWPSHWTSVSPARTAMTLLLGTAQDARVPELGASSAIAAVPGAYFVLYPGSGCSPGFFPIFLVRIPARIFLGAWFLYQLIEANFGLFNAHPNGGGVAFFAHVGEFPGTVQGSGRRAW
jgi:hypothetical protein